jgi:hypothetical protein
VDLHSQRPGYSPRQNRKQTAGLCSLTPFQIRHRNSEQEHLANGTAIPNHWDFLLILSFQEVWG